MARQIAAALVMSLEERRERWQSMVRKLKAASVQNWFADFLHTLADRAAHAAARRDPADRARTRQSPRGE